MLHAQADICQLGMDQRKVNMLAREYCDAKKRKFKPVILSHPMMPGLLEVGLLSTASSVHAAFDILCFPPLGCWQFARPSLACNHETTLLAKLCTRPAHVKVVLPIPGTAEACVSSGNRELTAGFRIASGLLEIVGLHEGSGWCI